jgi:hypothetical protein
MSADIHGVIADWLHAHGIGDMDGFGKRSASAIASLETWDKSEIRGVLSRIRTDLFQRNTGIRKAEICDELANHVASRCSLAAETGSTADSCTIVFFAANPQSTTQLDLAEEIRAITEKIRASKHRDSIDFVTALATRPDDLLQYLNEHDARAVHFSGHGSGTPGLVLQDETGQIALVDAAALRALFKVLKGNVRLVVLNACDSLEQARGIAKEIDCVIGMRASIGDEAARIFAASLYRAIGFGKSVQEAFDQGKTALMLHGIPEDKTPILLCRRGVRASMVQLVNE